MNNPWLDIPLADYEAHMDLPEVGQAQLLADVFATALAVHAPCSVAVLGCAGGNGFDRIPTSVTERIVGIDVNPEYIDQARRRYAHRLPGLELFAGDVQHTAFAFAPVELVYAGLLFEYVDVRRTLERIRAMLCRNGRLVSVVQLPNPQVPEVSPSPFTSLSALSKVMHLVAPESLREQAESVGFRQTDTHHACSSGGKRFCVQTFQRGAKPDLRPPVTQTLRPDQAD